jgi:putative alpha-1,2-mannosidase
VRDGMKENFTTGPGGLPGNDDCGTLSCWYVFSALGFYPDNPVSGNFALGTPLFRKVTIKLNSQYYKGKTFVISSEELARGPFHSRNVEVNGKHQNFISHSDIENGGHLAFKRIIPGADEQD